MPLTVFLEKQGLKLMGDSRDIMVPRKYQSDVLKWCKENNVEATIGDPNKPSSENAMVQRLFNVNLWRVKDDKQRTWFALRWSGL